MSFLHILLFSGYKFFLEILLQYGGHDRMLDNLARYDPCTSMF